MPDNDLEILRKGPSLSYTPPEGLIGGSEVEGYATSEESEEAKKSPSSSRIDITSNDIVHDVEATLEETVELKETLEKILALAQTCPVPTDFFDPQDLSDLGITEGTVGWTSYRQLLSDSRPASLAIQDLFLDFHLGSKGRNEFLLLDDLYLLEDSLKGLLTEILASGFYADSSKDGFKLYYDQVTNIINPYDQDYRHAAEVASFYQERSNLGKKKLSSIKSYFKSAEMKLTKELWDTLIGRLLTSDNREEILKALDEILRALKTLNTIFQIAYLLPNIKIKSLHKSLRAMIMNQLKENLRSRFNQLGWEFKKRVSSVDYSSIFKVGRRDIASEAIAKYLYEILSDSFLDLSSWNNKFLKQKKNEFSLFDKKKKGLIKKKNFDKIQKIFGAIIASLQDARQIVQSGTLPEKWYWEFYEGARKESEKGTEIDSMIRDNILDYELDYRLRTNEEAINDIVASIQDKPESISGM